MLGHIVSYAAKRAAGDAVNSVTRRALWGGIAALLFLACFVLAILIAFWHFEPDYGAIPVACGMAAAFAVLALLALFVPRVVEWSKAQEVEQAGSNPVSQAASAVVEETEAAVDYFGAIQVVASAFMFGLGAARQIRKR